SGRPLGPPLARRLETFAVSASRGRLRPKKPKTHMGIYAIFVFLVFLAAFGALAAFAAFLGCVRVSIFLVLMVMALGLTTSFLGQVMVRAPFSYWASILAASTAAGSRKAREKEPWLRSTRW